MVKRKETAEAPMPSVDAALATVADQKARDAEQERVRRDNDSRLYCELLARADNNPEPSDAAELVGMLADGFVTAYQLQKHRTAVAELRRLIGLHGQREAAREKLKPLVEERDVLQKRLEREVWEADKALQAAYGFSAECHAAAQNISRLLASHNHFKEGGLAEILGHAPPDKF